MRRAAQFFALLMLAATAFGQELLVPAPPTTANPNNSCSVEGVVIKATTGDALRKVAVNLMALQGQHQNFTSVTDMSGHFAFNGIEPGQYILLAGGNGYPQQQFGARRGLSGGKTLTLPPGGREANLIFRLAPPGVITGTVRDEEGDPVVGGQVQAMRIVHTGRREQFSSAGYAQTNDLGQYRIYGLEPGQYLIMASYQRQVVGDAPGNEVYLPTFHPATPDSGQAAPLEVSPGDEVSGIDVDLKSVHSVSIRGRILAEVPVKSMRGIYVSAMPRDSFRAGYVAANYGGGVQDEGGNFEIHGVPPGSYVLFAGLNDGNRSYSGRALVEAGDSNVEGVTVEVGLGMTLRGHVRLSSGAELDFTRLGVSLQPTENYAGGAGTQVKPDGSFVLENVTDGSYHVQVGGFPEEFYLQAVRSGGADVLGTGLIISHHNSPGDLDVVLSKDGGRVDGVVRKDQKPVTGAVVVLIPDPPNRDRNELYSSKSSDALGRYSLLGLPPGDFKLFAWEQREGLSYYDPDFMKDFEDQGTHVHIDEKKTQFVPLEAIANNDQP